MGINIEIVVTFHRILSDNGRHILVMAFERISRTCPTTNPCSVVRQPRHISRCLRKSREECIVLALTGLFRFTIHQVGISSDFDEIGNACGKVDCGVILSIFESTHSTRLIYKIQSHVISSFLCTSGHREIMCLYYGRTEHIVLPIEIGILGVTDIIPIEVDLILGVLLSGSGVLPGQICQLHIFCRIGNPVVEFGRCMQTNIPMITNAHLISHGTLLGSNENNTVGGSCSVNGCRSSIFQNGNTLDHTGVEVGHTTRYAIDQDQRI